MSCGGDDGEEAMKGMSREENERILVSVRVRPLNEKEAAVNEVVDWECINDTTIVNKNNQSPERSVYPSSYTFDRVFRFNCSTRQVYEEGAKSVVLSVVRGINSSVFAYGQTSSGKTFTMSGITEYTMMDIFDYIQKHKERDFHLKFSALEIYNESVRDLLTSDNSPLRLLDDPERGTVVERLTEETLRDWNHFQELLGICEAQRQIGETFLNEASSRSHQILRLTIESSPREYLSKNNSSTLAATLNFVDLAGSERASQALSAGSRLKEGSHINRSLLTLGTVIRKLSKGGIGHIPYRDSKLTRILQSSLGGNARTAIICTMSPARSYSEQSRNTLLFASCAKEVTTNAHINVIMSDKALVRHLQRELARLEGELRTASPAVMADATELLRDKDSKIEELERRVKELTLQLDRALSQIHDLQHGSEDQSQITWEGEVSSYPKLHVRQASRGSSTDSTTEIDNHSFDAHSPASGSPHSPDRYSRRSYGDNYSISDDFDENQPPTSPFGRIFIETSSDTSTPILIPTPDAVGNTHHLNGDSFGEQTSNYSELDPYMVSQEGQTPNFSQSDSQLATVEQTLANFEIYLQQGRDEHGSQSPYFVDFDPYHVADDYGEHSPTSSRLDQPRIEEIVANPCNSECTDPHQTSEARSEQTDNHVEDNCEEVQCIESETVQSCPLLLEEAKRSLSMGHGNDACTVEELVPEDKPSEVKRSSLQDPNEPSGEPEDELQSSLHDPNEPSGTQLEDELAASKNLSSVERSIHSEDISGSPLSVEKVKYEMKIENADGSEDLVDRPEDVQRKVSALKHNADGEAPQIPSVDVESDEDRTPVTDVKASNHIDYSERHASPTETTEKSKALSLDHPQFPNMQEMQQRTRKSTKKTKDVGLSAEDLGATAPWPSDCKSLQREIIELWEVCNISLVHRTFFFLVFIKGDQSDTIYLEVERRRLSCIRDAYAWGNSIDLDNHKLTPGSSRRSLHLERVMLARLMKRRLSRQQRGDLYVKWGIRLDSKRRRFQLASRLWDDTSDLDHIEESASIVAKLVRFSEPQVPKEVFGLNLMTKTNQGRRKSLGWKPSPRLL